jgi:hypothetical protein
MLYGLDCLYPPSPTQAREMREAGWQWLAVYVGGPRAAAHSAWQEVAASHTPIGDLAGIYDSFLPIYVGRNFPWDGEPEFTYQQGVHDGEDTLRCMEKCCFTESSPVALDVEYGCFQHYPDGVHQYVQGWVEIVNRYGHRGGVYSDIETLNHLELGDLVDFKWGAAWVRDSFSPQPPFARFDPTSPPPWDVWQYGGGELAGVAVDVNSAVDDFEFASYAGSATPS